MHKTRERGVRGLKAVAAAGLVFGTLGVAGAMALSSTAGAAKVVVRDGFTCTKVGTGGVHHVLVGRKGQVVCATKGNVTLIARGTGRIVLIAGSGHDTLIASSAHGHDILVGGTGVDRFVGGNGWDTMQGGSRYNTFHAGNGSEQFMNGGRGANTFDCNSNSQGTDVVVTNGRAATQDDDCNSQHEQDANQEWQGAVTATDGSTTMTITWTDANDAAKQWLTSQVPPNPTSVTFDITNAKIEKDDGGKVAVGDTVEVESNGTGTTLTAISVQAGRGDDDNQGDDNGGGNDNCQGNEDSGTFHAAGSSGSTGPTGPSGCCGGGDQNNQDSGTFSGSSGSTGPSGNTGSCGPTGSTGPSGPSGPSGASGNE